MLKKRRRKRKREKTNKQKKNKQGCENYKENTGTKLISNTKKHKLKIQSRVWNFRYTMLFKRRERNREKKSHRNYKKNYRYKIDNIYQKAKIKNLEQSLEFQKYNVKEKKKEKKQGQKIIKYIYIKFAEEEKNRVFFFFFKVIGYKVKIIGTIEDLKNFF